jgi:hypothetical protein
MLRRLTALAPALLLLSGCAYDYAGGYAPDYPPGYDSGIGGGDVVQPGDLFGGQNVASVELFYAPLAGFGRWADTRFGYAFIPAVQAGWRPYVNGRWGDNRLWISNDPWGWATDHYGRWGFDDRIGWVWVPGTEWAPSWVAWREDDNVAGWAPIPPGVRYSVSIGFGGGNGYDDWNSWYSPSWVWVPRPYLYRPGFGGGVLPWQGGRDYWRTSRWQGQSGWNGRPGYDGWNRPGNTGNRPPSRPGAGQPYQPRPGAGRPAYGRPPGQDDNWQGRPRPDGGTEQWQGRPRPDGSSGQWQGRPQPDGDYRQGQGRQGRPGASVGQPPRGGINGEPPMPGQPQYQPRPQASQGGYRGDGSRGGGYGQAPLGGIPGQQPPAGYRPAARSDAMTKSRGGRPDAGAGDFRPPPSPAAPPPRVERPAQRQPAPARENQNERPD